MAKKKENSVEPIDSLSRLLTRDVLGDVAESDYTQNDEEFEIPEGLIVGDKTIEDEEVKDPSEESEEIDEIKEDEVNEDDEEIEEEVIDPIKPEDIQTEDLGEIEPQIASYLEEKLYEKFGWSLEEEDERANSVDAIVDLLQNVVEENSKPIFANDDIEKLNEYVNNGGNLREYFSTRYSETFDIDKADLEREADQEKILREYFRTQKASEESIDKKIKRYDDTGTLRDEAEDALDLLKKSKGENAEKLLEEQQKVKKENEKQQQKFYNDVTSYIRSKNDVRGVPISKDKKEKMIKALFQVGSDGVTEYQKKYQESLVTNLVDSVYFSLFDGEYETGLKKKVTSKATSELKKKLQASKTNNKLKSGGDTQTDSSSQLDRLSRMLRK